MEALDASGFASLVTESGAGFTAYFISDVWNRSMAEGLSNTSIGFIFAIAAGRLVYTQPRTRYVESFVASTAVYRLNTGSVDSF